jgi:hypothetical protein
MNFRIHNLKLKPWNNSCEFVPKVQPQWYATSLIHLKNDAKQNKDKNNCNSNEHKWDTIEGKLLTYGCVNLIVTSWKENLLVWTPNNVSIFIIDVCNSIQGSHKQPLQVVIVAKHDNSSH